MEELEGVLLWQEFCVLQIICCVWKGFCGFVLKMVSKENSKYIKRKRSCIFRGGYYRMVGGLMEASLWRFIISAFVKYFYFSQGEVPIP